MVLRLKTWESKSSPDLQNGPVFLCAKQSPLLRSVYFPSIWIAKASNIHTLLHRIDAFARSEWELFTHGSETVDRTSYKIELEQALNHPENGFYAMIERAKEAARQAIGEDKAEGVTR